MESDNKKSQICNCDSYVDVDKFTKNNDSISSDIKFDERFIDNTFYRYPLIDYLIYLDNNESSYHENYNKILIVDTFNNKNYEYEIGSSKKLSKKVLSNNIECIKINNENLYIYLK